MRLVNCSFLATAALAYALVHSALAKEAFDCCAKAIANESTAPSYVLITIVNDNTESRQTICTLATFFEGAIHSQYHLPYTMAGLQKGRQIALANKDRVYHFSELRALKNLRVRYTPQGLAQMRQQLSEYSTAEIVAGMSSSQGILHHLYDKQKSFALFAASRDALAYILLERGLQVGQGDLTGGLYLIR